MVDGLRGKHCVDEMTSKYYQTVRINKSDDNFLISLLQASVASAVPFIVTFIVVLLGGLLADSLRERNLCSTGAVRKIFTALGN